jgi:G3E family GTPase
LKKFWLDKELESPIQLNAILCFIDCYHFEKNKQHEVFESQIISADKIILNKTDLITDSNTISEIKCYLSEVNPFAEIYETKYSEIPVEFLSDNNSVVNIKEGIHKHHHSVMENIVIQFSGNKSLEGLDKIIGNILWDYSAEKGFEIIRFKGIIYLDSKKYLLQGLYDLYEFEELPSTTTNSMDVSKILFIGKNLQANKVYITSLLN